MSDEALAPYQGHLVDVTKKFTHITYTYLPCEGNQFADALAKLVLMINIPSGIHSMPLLVERKDNSAHCYTIEVCSIDLTTWYYDIYQYLIKK